MSPEECCNVLRAIVVVIPLSDMTIAEADAESDGYVTSHKMSPATLIKAEFPRTLESLRRSATR